MATETTPAPDCRFGRKPNQRLLSRITGERVDAAIVVLDRLQATNLRFGRSLFNDGVEHR
ncbi:MAG TPA: hypothetical protein VK789_32320 [Bryobacteraceae bacterium]|nr:hypothetical protein [Bryobacteraceae bacterium]